MKIIYGITKSNYGGAQRYVFDLAKAAQEAGHEVAVMTGGNGILVDKLKEKGIKVIEIRGMKRDISLVDEIRSFHFIFRTLFAEKPDVFHTNSSKMGGIGNLAARLAGVKKIIFTSHGWAWNEPRPMLQKIIIKCFAWLTIILSTKTISVSEAAAREVRSWPFVKEKLTVIHNGIAAFDLLPRQVGGFTVGTIAELHPVKGLDVLLRAWAEFAPKRPQAKLVIMGEGEEREHLETLARELGISDSVSFEGYVENARRKLLGFDIFVLPSRSENLPYAVLEAGLAGLPVIATSVGGIPEIITTGENGVLVAPENAHEIFSSLLLLAEDAMLRKRLGESLKKKIESDFSIKNMAETTLAAY